MGFERITKKRRNSHRLYDSDEEVSSDEEDPGGVNPNRNPNEMQDDEYSFGRNDGVDDRMDEPDRRNDDVDTRMDESDNEMENLDHELERRRKLEAAKRDIATHIARYREIEARAKIRELNFSEPSIPINNFGWKDGVRDGQNEFWALKQMEGILKEPSPEDDILPEEVLDSDITIALKNTKVGAGTARKANQYLSKLQEQARRPWKRICLTKNYDKSINVHFDKMRKKKMTLMLIWHAKTWLSDSDNYVEGRILKKRKNRNAFYEMGYKELFQCISDRMYTVVVDNS